MNALWASLLGQTSWEQLLHSSLPTHEEEARILSAAIAAGAHDGCTMEATPTVDGFPLAKHVQILDQLREISRSVFVNVSKL